MISADEWIPISVTLCAPLPPKSMLYCHSRDSPVELCGSATALRLNIDWGGEGVGTESQNCHRYVLKTDAVSGIFNLPEQ